MKDAAPMKTIGLLGGTAWVSTIEYYRQLNQRAVARFGAWHSAPLILRSIDYAPIVSRYADDWAGARDRFAVELGALEAMGPDCLVVCCNTLHKALDELPSHAAPTRPVIHMVDETARTAVNAGHRRVLLLGTRFTMENGYYASRLAAAGLAVVVPDAADREMIEHHQSLAAAGKPSADAPAWFGDLLARHPDCDAAVLGCTELPELVDASSVAIALLDPLAIQCAAAFDFAVKGH